MFDFDPDNLIEEDIEDEIDLDPIDPEDDVEETDNDVIEKAIITGAIFGMGVEEGRANKDQEKKGERSPGAVSLKTIDELKSGETKKKKRMRPFEQWIYDICVGRKSIKDEL